jgi:hypothetical protein
MELIQPANIPSRQGMEIAALVCLLVLAVWIVICLPPEDDEEDL